jgi:hypothetical protein
MIFQDVEKNRLQYSKQIKIWSDFLIQLAFCSLQDRGLALVQKHSALEQHCLQLLSQIFSTSRTDEVRFFWLSLEAIISDYAVTLNEPRFSELLSVLKRYCLDRFSAGLALKNQKEI